MLSSNSEERFTYAQGYVISSKYELELMLGEGGMGAVWRARNMQLDSAVAIKLIRAGLNRDALSTRLLQEARAAAKLGHPAIVRVFDVGQTEYGDPFIVMELLRGESFGNLLLAKGRLPATRAVQLLLPIADALSAAHGKRIVHRDLKPDNVFVANEDGQIQPKLVDFGIAKLEQRDGGSLLTQAGVVLGSPEYMSPEQARGQDDLDSRTDIWSFCVVLYEALTGQVPFTGSNYNAIIRAIVETEPTKATDLAAGDIALWRIIERGLAKDRAQRWKSMGELGKELAGWLLDHGITEDICGVSLEARWHGRSTDPPEVTGRRSIPDFDLEPISRVRSPSSGQRAPIAATVAPSEPPDTHRAVSTPVAAPQPVGSRRRVWVYSAIGAAALIIGVVFGLTRTSSAPSVPSATPAALPAAQETSTRGTDHPAPSAAADPIPPKVVEAAPSSTAPTGSVTAPKSARPRQAPVAPRKGSAPKNDQGSDLLAPY